MSASSKRLAEESLTNSQVKRTRQAKLDRWISPSPVTARGRRGLRKGNEEVNSPSLSQGASSSSSDVLTGGQKTFSQPSTSTPRTPPVVRRSDSIRTPPLSSTKSFRRLFSQSSVEFSFSQDSRDSILGESSQDLNSQFDINQISTDPKKQKQYLVHHLVAQRRLHDLRLEVRSASLPGITSPDQDAQPLSALKGRDIWTSLSTETEWRHLGTEHDDGWLEACSLLTKYVSPSTFPPAAAVHKVLTEAVMKHRQDVVRGEALRTLCHCLRTHPPGKSSCIAGG